ncbi:MAG TPA: flavodoxin domain-containing protein, partial [Flavisolibacter sp.]|nr:flavodoxin domain-containing protein [Flavisolibacter sp.]
VQELVADLTKEELIWLNGYLTGIVSADRPALPAPEKASVGKITITYGTESGNSKKLAATLAAKAKKKGIQTKLVSLDQYKLNDLPREEWFFTIISTQGEGEPPATALKFYRHIHENPLSLSGLKYGVLALGDTSYPLFCKAGEDVDLQFQKLGASRVVPLQKLDTDYEAEANQWFDSLLASLDQKATVAVAATPPVARSGKQKYKGTIIANIDLNGRGSKKSTHHIEIAASDVNYQAGDAIGIVPKNDTLTVARILKTAGVSGNEQVMYKEEAFQLIDLLTEKLSIYHLSERVVRRYAELAGQSIPETRIDLLDLLRIYPLQDPAQFTQVAGMLETITPRLYSIASSPAAHEGEVHLTVGKHNFHIDGFTRNGLCSAWLSGLSVDSEIEFYIHKNHLFKLPDENKDVIMIGPGTGIAPFRSFVAERDATGASGRNWLFFGDQHFTSDFLYQTEWQNWLQTGVLTRISLAFSRDSKEKVYVQHKLWQQAAAVMEWLEGGAYLYICGTKDPMSRDVEHTLQQIIEQEKGFSSEEAASYLEGLKESGRLVKDVY